VILQKPAFLELVLDTMAKHLTEIRSDREFLTVILQGASSEANEFKKLADRRKGDFGPHV